MFSALNQDCLDQWLADYEHFRRDFLHFCYFISKGCGYYPHVDFGLLETAHKEWIALYEVWESKYLMGTSNGLSHLKIMALLLFSLAQVEWVKDLEEFDPSDDRREGEYNGTPEEREESRKDINAGRGTFLAFQFVSAILNAFEEARDDRVQPFQHRLTPDLEHDFMVYLLSERREPMAIFLIFKALYVRDEKPKATSNPI